MIATEEQQKTLTEAAKPLVKWLNDNCHPHCKVIVEPGGIELVEGVCADRIEEFIKD